MTKSQSSITFWQTVSLIFLAFFILILLSACQSTEFTKASDHFIPYLSLATSSDPKTFNPILAQETSSTVVLGYLFEGLTKTDGITAEVEPSLAESWESSADGKTWLFHLRPHVQWSDGEPFTASDVVFTFNKLIYNPDIPSSSQDIFLIEGKKIKIEELDPLTVRFTLPKPFAPFLRSLSQDILPQHIISPILARGEFMSFWSASSDPHSIVGTGPFILDNYKIGERIILKKNPRYWQAPKPYLPGIMYSIISSQDITMMKFIEGELDIYGLRGEDLPYLKKTKTKKGFQIYKLGPTFSSTFLAFNLKQDRKTPSKPYFRDLKFRKALAHSIDKQTIINVVHNGLGVPQDSPLSPSSKIFFSDKTTKYPYDPALANQLLDEAGYTDSNHDGIREDHDGKNIEFRLFTNTDRADTARLIRKDLENIGIKAYFQAIDFNTLVSKLTSTYDWDAVIIGFTGGLEPHFGNNLWQSSATLHIWNPKQETPQTPWEAKIDQIFNQAATTLDQKKRYDLYEQWQKIVSDKLPVIYTTIPNVYTAVSSSLHNIHPSPFGGVLHNIVDIKKLKKTK